MSPAPARSTVWRPRETATPRLALLQDLLESRGYGHTRLRHGRLGGTLGHACGGGDVMKTLVGALCATVLAVCVGSRSLTAAATCESLASMGLPKTTITLARLVQAGAFTPPTAANAPAASAAGQAFRDLPEFCRIAATLEPSSDSDIKIERARSTASPRLSSGSSRKRRPCRFRRRT